MSFHLLDNGPCLGWRDGFNKPYQWLHYNEALLRAKNFGSGLLSLGLAPGPQTLVGLYSQNCPEWVLTEQACYTYSLVVVPLYDTLGPDACAYIINQAEINLVVCEDDQKCNLLLDKAPRYVNVNNSPKTEKLECFLVALNHSILWKI